MSKISPDSDWESKIGGIGLGGTHPSRETRFSGGANGDRENNTCPCSDDHEQDIVNPIRLIYRLLC